MSYEQTAAHNKSFGIQGTLASGQNQARRIGILGNPDSPATFDSAVGLQQSIRDECAQLEPRIQLLNKQLYELEDKLGPILSGGYPPPPIEAQEGMSDMQRYLNGINHELAALSGRINALIGRVTL